MAAKLRIVSKLLLNIYPKLYFTIKGIKNTPFVNDKKYINFFIKNYGGNIDLFLLDNFPNIFWEKRAHWEQCVKNIEDKHFIKILKEILVENRTLMSIEEIYNIYNIVKQIKQIEGDMAEVGVYKGGSAKIICEAKGGRKLHLFDTFEGMPEVRHDIDIITKGSLSDTSLKSVKKYLSGYNEVYFYKGIFPDSANDLEDIFFSFVNLDVDIYTSTLSCLKFFYPRMKKGACILSHDYSSKGTPGVKRAFNEFFSDKPELVIELWTTQCLVIKN